MFNKFGFDFSDVVLKAVDVLPHYHYVLMGEDTEDELYISVARIPGTPYSLMMSGCSRYGMDESTYIEIVDCDGSDRMTIEIESPRFALLYAGINDTYARYICDKADDVLESIAQDISKHTFGDTKNIMDILATIISLNSATPFEYGTEEEYIEYLLESVE